jgi:hypothetical protein
LIYKYALSKEKGNNESNDGWEYPSLFISPSTTTIGENSVVNYSFDGTILGQPKDDKTDRTEVLSKLVGWVIAYFQMLDAEFDIVYTSRLQPFDTNYDAELVGWKFTITIKTTVDCII